MPLLYSIPRKEGSAIKIYDRNYVVQNCLRKNFSQVSLLAQLELIYPMLKSLVCKLGNKNAGSHRFTSHNLFTQPLTSRPTVFMAIQLTAQWLKHFIGLITDSVCLFCVNL
jgi:hypothetical protein